MFCKPGTLYYVDNEFDESQLRTEIRNVFRYVGAPWFEGICPSVDAATAALERAYQQTEQQITHLVPLDIADDLPRSSFGPFEIRQFSRAEFSDVVGLARLKRYGAHTVPDVAKLSQFTWLIYRETRARHKPWRSKTFLSEIHLDEVGRVRQLRRRFSPELELGLFVLTLAPWEEIAANTYWTWQPFRFPWVYAISDDPFREPSRSPDPASLTWEDRYDPSTEDVYEAPLRNTLEDVNKLRLQTTLPQFWQKAAPILTKALIEEGCFNPLVEHYFLRAFEEEGLDQLLWHTASVDAAVGKKEGSGSTERLFGRLQKLTGDHALTGKFQELYDRRSEYIHGRKVKDKNLWQVDLATARKVARLVVTGVLELAHDHPTWSRDELLAYLNR